MDTNTQNKPTPHPHAELIKAWADGAKIQYKNENNEWITANPPSWYKNTEYRIKPEEHSARWKPKMGEEYTYLSFDDGFLEWKLWNDSQTDIGRYEIGNCFRTKEEAEAAASRVRAVLKNNWVKKLVPVESLDGKPLTDGEMSLIRALRHCHGIDTVFDREKTILIKCDKDTQTPKSCYYHIAFIPCSNTKTDDQIIAALKQIQAEQEARNEAK